MKILKSCLIIAFFGCLQSEVSAQSWDYEKYPVRTIDYQHLDAEIRIDNEGVVEGDLLYNIRFRTSEIDSLVLDATHMDIAGVAVNERSRNYIMEKDRLIIYLENDSEKGAPGTLRVQYRTEPGFGIHHSFNQTLWTSMLPKSTRHWLPVADHPGTEFTTELIFTHPSGLTLVSNGRKSETDVLSVDEEMTTFRSNRPVSASSLAWALGDLTLAGSTQNMSFQSVSEGNAFQRSSYPQIYLYSELPGVDADLLMSTAAEAFHSVQDYLNYKFPFRDLQIVLVEDDKWETKSWGSGILFLFNDKGNLEEQVQKGVISQWFGAYVRENQWADAGAINVMRALLAEELFGFDGNYEEIPEPYHVYSDHELWLWQHYLKSEENRAFRKYLDENLRSVLTSNRKVIGWNELSERIYNSTGIPYFSEPELQIPETEEASPIEYMVEIQHDEEEGTVRLNFEAIGNGVEELLTVHAEVLRPGDSERNELTITGNSESVVISVSRGIENLKLRVPDRDDVILTERKPFLFWIHQLRNDATVERRVEAAAALSQFTDNPDLQLALTDLFRIETNPKVYAEMLRSLSAITMGASGTEQMFIDRASADQPLEVQKAAVEGMAVYQDNDRVIRHLRQVITETENREVRQAAVRSLFEITDPEGFRNIAETIVTTESVLPEVPQILRLLAENNQRDSAFRLADTFLDEGFPSQIRVETLKFLLEQDRSESRWENRLRTLLQDRDPRIRFIAAKGLDYIPSGLREELVTLRRVEEYDERVRREL